jgi:hypothetical protein
MGEVSPTLQTSGFPLPPLRGHPATPQEKQDKIASQFSQIIHCLHSKVKPLSKTHLSWFLQRKSRCTRRARTTPIQHLSPLSVGIHISHKCLGAGPGHCFVSPI